MPEGHESRVPHEGTMRVHENALDIVGKGSGIWADELIVELVNKDHELHVTVDDGELKVTRQEAEDVE